ncbi:MAG: hypothetical protein NC324_02220 [Bacteroides sp.]|nr:hypothetical protein [Bacteroides sp.]
METQLFLTSKELKERLRITHPMQFQRVLPELRKFGAFKLPGNSWRMAEEDYARYILAKKEEAQTKRS